MRSEIPVDVAAITATEMEVGDITGVHLASTMAGFTPLQRLLDPCRIQLERENDTDGPEWYRRTEHYIQVRWTAVDDFDVPETNAGADDASPIRAFWIALPLPLHHDALTGKAATICFRNLRSSCTFYCAGKEVAAFNAADNCTLTYRCEIPLAALGKRTMDYLLIRVEGRPSADILPWSAAWLMAPSDS